MNGKIMGEVPQITANGIIEQRTVSIGSSRDTYYVTFSFVPKIVFAKWGGRARSASGVFVYGDRTMSTFGTTDNAVIVQCVWDDKRIQFEVSYSDDTILFTAIG